MAWYEGVYSCGHEGRTNIIGPTKDRQWKADRHFEGLCPECAEKARREEMEKKNKEAEEKSAEMELPELEGTEKQVAWATTLRISVMEKAEKKISEFEEKIAEAEKIIEREKREGAEKIHSLKDLKLFVLNERMEKVLTSKEELADVVDYTVKKKTNARFWIDSRNRNGILADLIMDYRKFLEEETVPQDVKEEQEENKKNTTVTPDCGDVKEGIVKMKYSEENSKLTVSYVKDDEFMGTVKPLGYKWNGTAWEKKITEYTGSMKDRGAEIGNLLLRKGFTVQFPDTGTKDAAVEGKFTPENDRWVKYNKEKGKLAIEWKERSDALYESAKKLPGAKWNSGAMYVGMEFYREVEDFAETMGFSVSERARDEIEKYRKKEENFEKAKAKEIGIAAVTDEERLERTLKSGGTIIDDLVDD